MSEEEGKGGANSIRRVKTQSLMACVAYALQKDYGTFT